MRAHTVRFVTHDQGTIEVAIENLGAAAAARGWLGTGIYKGNEERYREEIRGQPFLTGLCGPMYDGPGVVRYETQAVYDFCSR